MYVLTYTYIIAVHLEKKSDDASSLSIVAYASKNVTRLFSLLTKKSKCVLVSTIST